MEKRVKLGLIFVVLSSVTVLFFQNCANPLPTTNSNKISQSSVSDEGTCANGSIEFQGGCVQTTLACPVANGPMGLRHLITPPSLYGSCIATACNLEYQVDSNTGTCVLTPPPCPEGQQSNASGECIQTNCPDPVNQHIESNQCVSNVQSCPIENGQGQKVWTGSAYSACNAVSCSGSPTDPNGFHIEGSICKANKQACTIPGGSGFQYWNDTSKTYGNCIELTCESNYKTLANLCLGPLKAVSRYQARPNVFVFYWTSLTTGIPIGFTLEGASFEVFEQPAVNRRALRSCYLNGTYRLTTSEMGNVYGAKACSASAQIVGYIEASYSESTPRAVYHCSYYNGNNSPYKMTAVGTTECYGHTPILLGYVP